MDFLATTANEREQMLKSMGLESVEELFDVIPAHLRAASFDLPEGRSEFDLRDYYHDLGEQNDRNLVSFLGGGYYDHYIPAAVDELASRSEFYTSYTPYQPEASQGTLQAIYEFQSCVCRLLNMEVANASLYDGGTAVYEAMMMARRVTRRGHIILDTGLNPVYRQMIHTYAANQPVTITELPLSDGRCDRGALKASMSADTAAVIVQNPNFLGFIDDLVDVVEIAHESGALVIGSVYPVSLSLLKTPGECGMDIAVAEGQSLGMPLSCGGPYLGLMTCRQKYLRRMPGRIVGATTDQNGNRAYVMTMQAREQHIRRDRATSNICTNQALCALRSLITMSLLGDKGLKQQARLCRDKAEYAKDCLDTIEGVEVDRRAPTFNEFTVRLPRNAEKVVEESLNRGVAPGLPVGRYYPEMDTCLLVTLTEKRSRQDIDALTETLKEVL